MVNMDDDAPSGEAMLRALYERMASAPPPASVSSARLPSLTELAALMPERLSLARLQVIRRLSAQQRMVLGQLGDGLANKAIAHRMGVVEKTVEYHCDVLRKKLGIKERTALAAFAGVLSATRTFD